MLARVGRITLLVFQVLFLNAFVPGHTRGAITIDHGAQSTSTSCCHRDDSHDKAPTQKDRANCAVCFIAARYCTPPVYDYRLTEMGLLEVRPLGAPHVAESVEHDPTYHGRAPPAWA